MRISGIHVSSLLVTFVRAPAAGRFNELLISSSTSSRARAPSTASRVGLVTAHPRRRHLVIQSVAGAGCAYANGHQLFLVSAPPGRQTRCCGNNGSAEFVVAAFDSSAAVGTPVDVKGFACVCLCGGLAQPVHAWSLQLVRVRRNYVSRV